MVDQDQLGGGGLPLDAAGYQQVFALGEPRHHPFKVARIVTGAEGGSHVFTVQSDGNILGRQAIRQGNCDTGIATTDLFRFAGQHRERECTEDDIAAIAAVAIAVVAATSDSGQRYE